MRLTKANLARIELPPGKGELIVFDEALPGFGLRLRSGGRKTWIAQFRIGTKQRRIGLGTTEAVDPDEARKRAKEALGKVSLGRDPQTEKQQAKRQSSLTLGLVVPRYLTFAEGRHRRGHHADTKRYLERAWAPLHSTGLGSIDRAAVAARLIEIASKHGPYAANRARAALSAFYTWAIAEGFSHLNPVVGTNKPTAENSRDRLLTDQELKLVWACTGPGDFGAILRLLILTGARCAEIGGARWSEISNDVLRVGGERSKNGQAHEIPLTPLAASIIGSLSRSGDRDLIFGRGVGPFSGWSKSKAGLDQRVLKLRRGNIALLASWRLHDLRRTVATRMGDLGVQPHIVEAVLNHISGSKCPSSDKLRQMAA